MCSLETEVGEAEMYILEYKYLYPRRNYMSLHLLSRREGYTRVYTLVYPRVHNHTLSMVSVGDSNVPLSGLTLGHPRDATKALYRMWNNPPRELETRIDKGGYVSALR